MASYVVMEPPIGAGRGGAGQGGEDRAVLVRDGFHLLAFLIPILWLLWHRLWIEALAAFVAVAALGALAVYAGLGMAAFVLSLLVRLYVGMEGAALKAARYRRRGWREWGVVEADDAVDAETRYLSEAVADDVETVDVVDAPAAPTVMQPRVPAGPALGMLGYPARS